MEQNTDAWLAMRKRYLGASDAPILMGVNKKYPGQVKKTPYLLWKEKLGLEDLNISTPATRYGNAMEPYARKLYEDMIKEIVAPEVIFHPSIPFMMASLDGLTIERNLGVEIKCANREDHATAESGNIPLHYYPQVQHQLSCLGHEMMHYFSFHKGEGIIVEVKRDENYLEKLHEEELQFWSYVEDLKEPPLTEDDYLEQGKEWITLADGVFFLKQKIKQLQAQCIAHEEELKKLSEGKNSRGGEYRYVSQTRKGSVNYAIIPALKDVDLDHYRRRPMVSWYLRKDQK